MSTNTKHCLAFLLTMILFTPSKAQSAAEVQDSRVGWMSTTTLPEQLDCRPRLQPAVAWQAVGLPGCRTMCFLPLVRVPTVLACQGLPWHNHLAGDGALWRVVYGTQMLSFCSCTPLGAQHSFLGFFGRQEGYAGDFCESVCMHLVLYSQ